MMGDEATSEISVRLDFYDGSTCLAPSEWKYEQGQMPQRGARFILLLDDKDEKGTYSTYRGDFGRFFEGPDAYKIEELARDCQRKVEMKKSEKEQVPRAAKAAAH